MAALGVASAVKLDHAVHGGRSVAAIDHYGRPVQRIQAEAAADLVVADDQVIDIPPAVAAARIHRGNELPGQADLSTLVMDRHIHGAIEIAPTGGDFRLRFILVGIGIPLIAGTALRDDFLGLPIANELDVIATIALVDAASVVVAVAPVVGARAVVAFILLCMRCAGQQREKNEGAFYDDVLWSRMEVGGLTRSAGSAALKM